MPLDTVLSSLPPVMRFAPPRYEDARGYFQETWNQRAMAAAGVDVSFVQDNHSLSRDAGTLRGLHYQAPPYAQDKLVRCTRGAILDVAVDVRRGSPTYGQWVSEELSAENGIQLFVPKGFLHGFLTRVPDTEVQYKCSDYYTPEADGCVLWSSLGIDWGLTSQPILSEKDAGAEDFDSFHSPFVWEAGP